MRVLIAPMSAMAETRDSFSRAADLCHINIDKRFDFSKLMPEAIAYINHGGQNSIMTGLMYGFLKLYARAMDSKGDIMQTQ
ncbi:hypothetical protein [Clostridium sp. BJN0013]|uniref:hypothetical protein n=1 Tax=Clostridium sp. BJN0013 TaxID=3236840 RepID=UPI0034C626A7